MEAAHSIGGQSVIHRDAPKSLLVYSLFAIRKLLGIATFALIVVLLGPKLFVLFDNPKNATVPAMLFQGRDYILKKLDENHGNISRTAEVLGLERSHLYRKMKTLGIAVKE